MKTTLLMLFYVSFLTTRFSIAADTGWVEIPALHPTQKGLGMLEVAEKRDRLAGMDENEQRKYLKKRPVPVVIGPDKRMYLLDRHHMARAAWEAGVKRVFVETRADWSDLSPEVFWKKMQNAGWVYLKDEKGEGPLKPSALPDDLFQMEDDPFRSLAWKVRKRGGFDKGTTPFVEFAWADFFRAHIPLWDDHKGFKRAIEQAYALARSASAKHLPGYLGAQDCGGAIKRFAATNRQ